MRYRQLFLTVLFVIVLAAGSLASAQDNVPPETGVITLALAGPAAESDAELSGMAWYGDTLLLLAENAYLYASEGDVGAIFALQREDIMAYLSAVADGEEPDPLTPTEVPLLAGESLESVPGFDGFEAIAVNGDQVFLTIEAEKEDGTMRGDLVAGTIEPDLSAINLDLANRVSVDGQTQYNNMSYESLIIVDDVVWMFDEANGEQVNPDPMGYGFQVSDLAPAGTIPLENLEYRLTDATTVSEEGSFWTINYFFPGEEFLAADPEPLFAEYGIGQTHEQYPGVERLVKLQVTEDGVVIADEAPIQLMLPSEDGRNWEGIVRLDESGFLVVTDEYPETILGFIAYDFGMMDAAEETEAVG